MKKLISILVMFLGITQLNHAQNYSLDFKDPVNLTKAIFYAAETGDVDILNNFPDPLVENDLLTENITLITGEEAINEFRNAFKNGAINGELSYETAGGVNLAIVPVKGILLEGKSITHIVFINRYDNWFLYEMKY